MTFEEFLEEWHNDRDFIIAKTSGSTGSPKEIKLQKEFVGASAMRTNCFFSLGEGSRLYSCVSPDYIGGKMMAVRAVLGGCSLAWETPSNEPLCEVDPWEEIDLLAVVPSQMHHIVSNLSRLPKIRNIIVGGSAIPEILWSRISESGLNAYETYGMTETASHIALRKILKKKEPFTLLPGIDIETDSESCLKIKFSNDFIIQTNDIAEIISKNQFYIKGRRDNIIISGGKKINPFELENKISKYISSSFYLTGYPDEKWGEILVLVIEGNKSDFDCTQLKEYLSEELERWQLPKKILFSSSLNRTVNGKLLRANLNPDALK